MTKKSICCSVLPLLAATILSVFNATSFSMDSNQSQKINLAVVTLTNTSGLTDGESELIADRLRVELVKTGRANVMEREQMAAILKEQGFQQSGACTDEKCIAEMGQLLGVQTIISGSIGRLGNMYLVNLRIIDVRTGKITGALSRDIKGDLETVVGYIPGMAKEILSVALGDKTDLSAPVVQKKNVTIAPQPTTAESINHNKNRSGLRLLGGTQWGAYQFYLNGKEYQPMKTNTYPGLTDGYKQLVTFSSGPLVRGDLSFMLKAGDYINIELGPSFQWQNMSLKFDTSGVSSDYAVIDYMYGNASFKPGIFFVKRLYPFKINAGPFLDFGFTWWSSEVSYVKANGTKVPNTPVLGMSGDDLKNYSSGFGFGIGARVGAEYLFTDNFGINLDFLYKYARFQYTFNDLGTIFNDNRDKHIKILLDYQGGDHPAYEFVPAMFGCALGLNLYW